MQSTLFTELTPSQEANLSGGDGHKKYRHKKYDHKKDDHKKDDHKKGGGWFDIGYWIDYSKKYYSYH